MLVKLYVTKIKLKHIAAAALLCVYPVAEARNRSPGDDDGCVGDVRGKTGGVTKRHGCVTQKRHDINSKRF